MAAVAVAVIAAGCAGSASPDVASAPSEAPSAVSPVPTPSPAATAAPASTPEPELDQEPAAPGSSATPTGPSAVPQAAEAPTPDPAFAQTALPPAPTGFAAIDGAAAAPVPVSLEIEDIGVTDAGVIAVGVNADETFEVPPADEVGWYRFGPTPGADGSAVLAAHIAYDGVDGVFRRLADVEIGAIVTVGFDDGSSRQFRIDSVTDYEKEELPPSLFAREGEPSLALITCGGAFNRQLRSYESNTVAIAVPV